MNAELPALLDNLETRIFLICGKRVILSPHLAELYEVETKALNQAVRRNPERFPEDFMFQLSTEEWQVLRSHIVTSKTETRGGTQYAPYAFTEQGVAMLSSVLRSPRAISVNIEIMRTFVRMRRLLAENSEIASRLDELEKSTDERFQTVFEALYQLLEAPIAPDRRIGFRQAEGTVS